MEWSRPQVIHKEPEPKFFDLRERTKFNESDRAKWARWAQEQGCDHFAEDRGGQHSQEEDDPCADEVCSHEPRC